MVSRQNAEGTWGWFMTLALPVYHIRGCGVQALSSDSLGVTFARLSMTVGIVVNEWIALFSWEPAVERAAAKAGERSGRTQ